MATHAFHRRYRPRKVRLACRANLPISTKRPYVSGYLYPSTSYLWMMDTPVFALPTGQRSPDYATNCAATNAQII